MKQCVVNEFDFYKYVVREHFEDTQQKLSRQEFTEDFYRRLIGHKPLSLIEPYAYHKGFRKDVQKKSAVEVLSLPV